MREFKTVEEAAEFMRNEPVDPYNNDLCSIRKVLLWLYDKAMKAPQIQEKEEVESTKKEEHAKSNERLPKLRKSNSIKNK